MHLERASQFAQILRQVVGERIVVVQQKNHRFRLASFAVLPGRAASSARINAMDLFTDSSNSPAGVESATIPPPAHVSHTIFDDHGAQGDA